MMMNCISFDEYINIILTVCIIREGYYSMTNADDRFPMHMHMDDESVDRCPLQER